MDASVIRATVRGLGVHATTTTTTSTTTISGVTTTTTRNHTATTRTSIAAAASSVACAADESEAPSPVPVEVACVGSSSCIGGTVASAETVGADSSKVHELREALSARVNNGELPMLGLMVARRGRVIFSGAAGQAVRGSGRALGPDTVCRMYSMTKALVSTGALILIEQGKLQLDGKVSDYLPYWDDDKVMVASPDAAGEPVPADQAITIRMLCCHASGVASPTRVGWNPYTGETPTAQTLKDFVEVTLATPLKHQPGTQFEYAMSTDFLGAVIEEVSCLRLGSFLRENLFDPLGMPDTAFEIPEEKLGRFSEMYMGKSLRQYELAAPPLCWSDARTNWLEGRVLGHGGGGGILSTANDYMRFTQWLASGCTSLDGEAKALLSPSLIRELQVDQLSIVGASRGPCFDPYQGFCAIGGVVTSPAEPGDYFPVGSASGAGSMGWGGIAGTSFIADPEHELCIVLYTQVFDYHLCSPNLRENFQRAVWNCFPDLAAKMNTDADKAAGQNGNMVYLPV